MAGLASLQAGSIGGEVTHCGVICLGTATHKTSCWCNAQIAIISEPPLAVAIAVTWCNARWAMQSISHKLHGTHPSEHSIGADDVAFGNCIPAALKVRGAQKRLHPFLKPACPKEGEGCRCWSTLRWPSWEQSLGTARLTPTLKGSQRPGAPMLKPLPPDCMPAT